MAAAATFQWYDYLIFVATLVVSLGIGLYSALSGGRQRTTSEFLMGNRELGVLPVSLSMFMSYFSAIVILGQTAETYQRGAQMALQGFGTTLGAIGVCVLIVPLFFPLRLTSSFEYLDRRFKSYTVRLTGSLLLMISQILYMGIAMYSPATAMEAATGIKTWISILATGIVAAGYTTVGGMKAVVWTDAFQAFIFFGGIATVLGLGISKVGSITEVWNIAAEGKRLDIFNFDPNPLVRLSFWSIIIGRFISSIQMMGTGQTSVQRYCAVPTISKSRLVVLLNIPFMILIYSVTTLVGLTVYAYYTKLGCDPLRTKQINSPNQLLPFFIVNELRIPAIPGLFVAVLFSGALSSLSSSLNSLAAVTWTDILKRRFGHISESRQALVNKLLVALYGVIAIGVAFLAQIFGGHVLQAAQSFVGGVSGPLLGMFLLGALFPCANAKGAVVGAWTGLAMAMTMTIGSYITKPYRQTLETVTTNCSSLGAGWNATKPIATNPENVFPLFRVSFMWFASLGTVTCVAVGFVVSIVTGPTRPTDQDPRLIVPVFNRLLCCLPRSSLSCCWCGVRHDEVKLDENGHYPKEEEDDDASKGTELQASDPSATKASADRREESQVYNTDAATEKQKGILNPAFSTDLRSERS